METSTFGGRLDLAEVDVEAVREHERLAGGQMRRDVLVVKSPWM
jgi:hypothetical protein